MFSLRDGNTKASPPLRNRPRKRLLRPGLSLRIVLDHSSTYNDAQLSAPIAVQDPPPAYTARGFLNIIRHGSGPAALYVVTYRRLDREGVIPKPVLAEGARLLIELLERLGVNLELREVRDALEDILRLGSANIPDLWLTDEQMAEKGLVED